MARNMKQTLKNRLKADIHNYDQRIASVLRRIENALPGSTLELIQKYHNEMISESISKATQLKHLEVLLNLSRFLQKDWNAVTAEDIQKLVIKIIQEYSPTGQETHTTADHKKVLKIFFRWLKTGSRHKDPDVLDPIEIRKIKLRRVKDRLSREELISEADMVKILHACGENLRDKALYHLR
jgi:integrase/recombinase XerD